MKKVASSGVKVSKTPQIQMTDSTASGATPGGVVKTKQVTQKVKTSEGKLAKGQQYTGDLLK